MNRLRPTLFVVMTALALAAAGCGDDAQTHTTAADETTTTATTGADTAEQPAAPGTVTDPEDTSSTQAGGTTAPETAPH